jgi:hypothetical protein
MGVFLLPRIERRLIHPELATDIPDRGATFHLPEGVDDCSSVNFDRFMAPSCPRRTAEAAILL